jgi:hypothetical protein
MPIDYNHLNSGSSEVEPPSDGSHTAMLERASLVDTRSGEQVVTEWRDAQRDTVWWQSWNRFDTNGFQYTRELLIGLGVPLGKASSDGLPLVMDDDGLTRALEIAVGGMFDVRTQSRQGDGRVFVNTYVNGLTRGGLQLGLSASAELDVPFDTDGLPDVSKPPPVKQPVAAQAASEPLPWEDPNPPF